MTLTNAQVWTIILLGFPTLLLAIAAWESRGSSTSRILRALVTDQAAAKTAPAPQQLAPDDAVRVKEAVTRAGWSPGFVTHLHGEIDRVTARPEQRSAKAAGVPTPMTASRMPS